jgi:hypothetical protein
MSLYLKGPKKGTSLHVPQKRDAHSRALLTFQGPSKRVLTPGPRHGFPSEKTAKLKLSPCLAQRLTGRGVEV